MELAQLITPTNVCIDNTCHSKTAVLQKISELMGAQTPQINVPELFDAYWKRENLGSTAIGQGIAIPHVRSSLLSNPKACFIRLLNPVDFGAEDKQPADLVFGLVVPEQQHQQHLTILRDIIKVFSCPSFRKTCRTIYDPPSLLIHLVNPAIEETYA